MAKKKETAPVKVMLGRPGNTLKMGIVGIPNVGKSTTFNVLSKLHVPMENYPFCTVDPNIAKVAVPDTRFDKLVSIWKPKSEVPATLSIVDIAGLVPGAHEGKGLGNAFLSNISAVDGIFHVVRGFDDEDIIHTEGDVDPVRDLDIISTELIMKDKQHLAKKMDDVEKSLKRTNDKALKEQFAILEKVKNAFDSKKWIKDCTWDANEAEFINEMLFITAKPVVYLVNITAEDYKAKKNKYLKKISDWVAGNCPGPLIPYSANYEMSLLDDVENMKNANPPSVVSKLIKTGYDSLGLIHFFTAGEDEVRCWTIRKGTKAPQAAGVIHTDFEKGFICAETMKYDDFIACGSESEAKNQGKVRTNGKEYIVDDGDILFFRAGKS